MRPDSEASTLALDADEEALLAGESVAGDYFDAGGFEATAKRFQIREAVRQRAVAATASQPVIHPLKFELFLRVMSLPSRSKRVAEETNQAPGRCSSAADQAIRNRQVGSSILSAGFLINCVHSFCRARCDRRTAFHLCERCVSTAPHRSDRGPSHHAPPVLQRPPHLSDRGASSCTAYRLLLP
jgi:hypothetical protein